MTVNQWAVTTIDTVGGEKNYSVDGQSVSHTGFRQSMLSCLQAMAYLGSATEPHEIETTGET
jgi:hypothetical protein